MEKSKHVHLRDRKIRINRPQKAILSVTEIQGGNKLISKSKVNCKTTTPLI